ncbi:TonB c-terminal domain-containing protein [Janthinobacterium sp. HH01]|uniref:energy transducer TonB n=1 Tax=Janthinobacterium sp. HH01 TaxID=1198452 RepID=UPI0002AE9C3A|nr:energy transducer TonB [Janthinobacterium sp. HH01]ELX13169.1 TonB c-terminal domain-containing protein [Janthinobacterium sp. HH01]
MTAMTFESINYSPRRAAVRRQARPAPVVQAALPVSVAIPQAGTIAGKGNRRGLAAVVGLAVVLHAGVIVAFQQGGQIDPLPPKVAEPLAIEFAPPPPPPPEPPKVQPQVAKVAPAPAKAPPQVPVVAQAPVDDGPPSANTVQVATPAPPAPVAAAPAPPPPPEPVTEPRGYAGYRSNPAPDYPALAQDRGLQGNVVLKVHVLASGKPDNVAVDKSSGHKILDDAAVKAVLAWSFDPAKRGQTPIDGWVKVPLNFKLS